MRMATFLRRVKNWRLASQASTTYKEISPHSITSTKEMSWYRANHIEIILHEHFMVESLVLGIQNDPLLLIPSTFSSFLSSNYFTWSSKGCPRSRRCQSKCLCTNHQAMQVLKEELQEWTQGQTCIKYYVKTAMIAIPKVKMLKKLPLSLCTNTR
jgi:hypothetical protein